MSSGLRYAEFIFQSPSSVWRTTRGAGKNGYLAYISIPVLRVEDDRYKAAQELKLKISIPVLRVEDDCALASLYGTRRKFQSPSSVWRTTVYNRVFNRIAQNFNPRPPCGGRRLRRSIVARR